MPTYDFTNVTQSLDLLMLAQSTSVQIQAWAIGDPVLLGTFFIFYGALKNFTEWRAYAVSSLITWFIGLLMYFQKLAGWAMFTLLTINLFFVIIQLWNRSD